MTQYLIFMLCVIITIIALVLIVGVGFGIFCAIEDHMKNVVRERNTEHNEAETLSKNKEDETHE